jgi:23S rRNA (uracil1939-C5)-methyltransferase
MKNYGQIIEQLPILDMAAEGKCVARHEGKVIFVTNVAPGDIVDVKIIGRDKKFLEVIPVNFHTYSELRTDPFCSHFGICGGCKWQHIQYEKQLQFKQKQVADAFERIGKLSFNTINPIIASKNQTYYRNKLEFTFSNKGWIEDKEKINDTTQTNALGFHIPGRFDKILDIQHCYLQTNLTNQIRNGLKDFALENQISFFDLKKQEGLLRTMVMRVTSTNEWMVLVQFFYDDKATIHLVMNYLKNTFPFIHALLYVINPKGNETFHDLKVHTFAGKDHIVEQMEDLRFKIGPKSFYQTNSQQAYELYKIVRKMAALASSDVVYDLYTGTGTIAQFVAKLSKKVVGIEFVPMAVEDAYANAEINNLSNVSFFAGDMSKILNDTFLAQQGAPDVIITDPPRAGMAEDVLKMLLKIEAKTIIYVSCNPATQARDLAILAEKYQIVETQPVDMFPHTHHVENVVKLLKIS